MEKNIRDVIILGSGAAGYTAAVYTARANLEPLLIDGNLQGGQLTTTTDVENFPGFSEGVMGPQLMLEMRKQAERFGTEFKNGLATSVKLDSSPLQVHVGEEVFSTKALIVATGANAKTLGLDREWELMGYGLSTCATCDGAFFRDQEIVVVGGGDSACEEANFLTKFGKRVRVLVRRDEFRASKIMAERTLANPKIEVLWNTELIELVGDKQSGITGATIKNSKSGETSSIECAAIFYAIGHTPNSGFLENQLPVDDQGYIQTLPGCAATKTEGVFACGDVQDHTYRQAITAAGSGCMAAIEAERWLAEQE